MDRKLKIKLSAPFEGFTGFALTFGLMPLKENTYMYGNHCELSISNSYIDVYVFKKEEINKGVELVAAILRKTEGKVVEIGKEFIPYFDIEFQNSYLISMDSSVTEVFEYIQTKFIEALQDNIDNNDDLNAMQKQLEIFTSNFVLNHRHAFISVRTGLLKEEKVDLKDIYRNIITRFFAYLALYVFGLKPLLEKNNAKWYHKLFPYDASASGYLVMRQKHRVYTVVVTATMIKNCTELPVQCVLKKIIKK